MALLALTLAIRLIAITHYPYTTVNDARSYLHGGFEIARHGIPVDHNHGAGGTHGPSAYFPPAFSYPVVTTQRSDTGPRRARSAA